MARIIDCHCHRLDDSQVDWARELGYVKICLMDHRPEVLEEAMRKHPDFVIALGWLPMDQDSDTAIRAVDHFRDIGCLGYKICCAAGRYDDVKFYPVYERIQQHRMPIFFHTGWLDQRVAGAVYPIRTKLYAEWYQPMTLDRITLDFPAIKLVAFHMGGTQLADAVLLMRNHPNVYADSCRSFGPSEHFWAQIGDDGGGMSIIAKMVYGTDGMQARQACQARIESFTKLLSDLHVPPGLQDRVFYKNALHILGKDDELRKIARVAPLADKSQMDLGKALAGQVALPAVSDFVDHTLDRFGEPTRFATRCWIARDERALHVMFFCQDDKTANLAYSTAGPVANIWQDDSMEIFIEPDPSRPYCHITVNAGGRASLQWGRKDIQDYPATVVSRITPAGWAAKVEIPFDLLKAMPSGGAKWGLNLCRNKKTPPKETITWMEVATTFHDPTSFGWMVFD